MRRRRVRCGFTLAELLIVITILTIAATLLLPVVLNLARTRSVASATRIIQGKLHGARSLAVAQRTPFALRIYEVPPEEADAPQSRVACLITVPHDGSDTPAVRQERELLPTGVRVLVYQAGDTQPRPLPQRIRFQPDGTVALDLATPIRIAIINAEDNTDTSDIIVRRTGAIEVSE